MALSNETKRKIAQGAIEEWEKLQYQNELMGRTWGTLGNAANQEKCALAITEATKAISELQKELEAIPPTD